MKNKYYIASSLAFLVAAICPLLIFLLVVATASEHEPREASTSELIFVSSMGVLMFASYIAAIILWVKGNAKQTDNLIFLPIVSFLLSLASVILGIKTFISIIFGIDETYINFSVLAFAFISVAILIIFLALFFIINFFRDLFRKIK